MVRNQLADEQLIEQYIEPNPQGRGRQDARLAESGVSVWALMSRLLSGSSVRQLADEYSVPEEAIEAARAFYDRHRDLIDARIRINQAFFEE